MKIKAYSDRSDGDNNHPLGYVSDHFIHIGSIVLERKGNGGQISEAQAKELLYEAIQQGAIITIEFEHVEIVLGEL